VQATRDDQAIQQQQQQHQPRASDDDDDDGEAQYAKIEPSRRNTDGHVYTRLRQLVYFSRP